MKILASTSALVAGNELAAAGAFYSAVLPTVERGALTPRLMIALWKRDIQNPLLAIFANPAFWVAWGHAGHEEATEVCEFLAQEDATLDKTEQQLLRPLQRFVYSGKITLDEYKTLSVDVLFRLLLGKYKKGDEPNFSLDLLFKFVEQWRMEANYDGDTRTTDLHYQLMHYDLIDEKWCAEHPGRLLDYPYMVFGVTQKLGRHLMGMLDNTQPKDAVEQVIKDAWRPDFRDLPVIESDFQYLIPNLIEGQTKLGYYVDRYWGLDEPVLLCAYVQARVDQEAQVSTVPVAAEVRRSLRSHEVSEDFQKNLCKICTLF
ncbi:hypothetical protein SCB29_28890 [Paraburkholderia sp. SIMBA_055]